MSTTLATSHTDPAARPDGLLSPRYRTMTVAIVMLEALYAFEALGVATAMPTIATALDGLSMYAMAFGTTLAASVIGLVAGGQWSDARGAHPPLRAGIVAFVLGLLAAGLATDMRVFILGRAAQGLGGGLLSVALYIVVAQAYPKALHARMFAAFSAAWVVPAMVGPALSGLIVEHLHWRLVFLAVAAGTVMVAPLVLGPVRIAGSDNTARATTTSLWPRLAWAAIAAGGAMLLHPAARMGTTAGWMLCAFAILLLMLACRQLLPAGTLRLARGLPTVVALRGLASAAFFGTEALLPLMLSREHGFAPAQAGMALTLGAIGWSLGSWLRSRLDGCEPVRLMQAGLALLVTGTAATATAAWADMPVAIALCGWVAAGLGMGLTRPTLAVLTLELAPDGRQGDSASALQLFDALFTATVLAVSGSLLAARLTTAPTLAYASILGVSGLLALAALAAAGRARPVT
ncbi:MFS transporter [Marilutibacter alkalisoli]|uniref:MFS transporter n=1 Tax=Marilutibacter alkalisoli TaxID=2591633 RepID=A0A514BSA0_9GAMM|nr:MFS transporter [Lysobacter alkalisoli]QDH70264.1 MFS transporter [Lysobacter alkalisoli]